MPCRSCGTGAASATAESAERRRERELLAAAFEIAQDACEQTRLSLMAQLPFMDTALWHMPFEPTFGQAAVSSDGYRVYLNAARVVAAYRADPNEVLRDYLHCILHCVFRHPFDGKHPRTELWDLACDVCVEATAIELVGALFPSRPDAQRKTAIEKLREYAPKLTASSLYHLFEAAVEEAGEYHGERVGFGQGFLDDIAPLFRRDDHGVWTRTPERPQKAMSYAGKIALIDSDGDERLDAPDDAEQDADDEEKKQDRTAGTDQPGAPSKSSSSTAAEGEVSDPDALIDIQVGEEGEAKFAPLKESGYSDDFDDLQWKDISALIDMDMEAFTGKAGLDSGTFEVNLQIANRKEYDYREFLKRFSSLSEEMKVSPDEFDYIYYTYGLKHYDNMPLIEPLEYQESDRVRDFVIALDTSASCAGSLVKTFAEKTYDILKSSEGFGRKVNVHLIECDSDVRRDTKITSIRDLTTAFDDFKIRGFGGTDFRPVFRYVNDLIEAREFTNLKGLIYFTDGLGTYPNTPTDYETVFVFVNEPEKERKVPPWAMKVVMDEDEILEL